MKAIALILKEQEHRLAGADRSSIFFLKVKGLSFSITKEGGCGGVGVGTGDGLVVSSKTENRYVRSGLARKVWFQDFKQSLHDQSEPSITGHIDSTNDAVQRGMPATK
ncbi:hypothetical protein DPMN_157350 [Dreissena polymorpha]|uniref:Uncharacterized protein n=1 Tax=Dreissena polymorpha TaxID=45954 RepID=A0A9D4EFS3_DREPO|nr:hypothetical protein DPMN_157350 [Dreissena polymorpha]